MSTPEPTDLVERVARAIGGAYIVQTVHPGNPPPDDWPSRSVDYYWECFGYGKLWMAMARAAIAAVRESEAKP